MLHFVMLFLFYYAIIVIIIIIIIVIIVIIIIIIIIINSFFSAQCFVSISTEDLTLNKKPKIFEHFQRGIEMDYIAKLGQNHWSPV